MRSREKTAPRPIHPSASRPSPAPPLLIASLALGFALRLLASALPPHGLWGLDTLRRFPPLAVAAIVVIGAAGFVPAIANAIERGLDRIGALWERMGAWADALVAAGAGLVLFFLRDTVRFTGDFEPRLAQLMESTPLERMFPQAAPLDRLVNVGGTRLVIALGLEPEPALQAVGAVIGGLFAFAALAFLRAAGASRAMFPAAAAVVLGGGYMLHFAGYDKFGPLLLGVALASYGAARLARDGGGAWALALGAAACVLSHRTSYVLLPAAGVVMVQGWRREPERRARLGLALWAGVMLAVALALLPRTIELFQNLDRPVQQGLVPRGGEDAAAALARVRDAANLLFLLAPLWLAGATAAWLARGPARAPREQPRFSLAAAALLALGAEVGMVVATRGAQGAFRDWDMHAAAGATVTLLSAAALIAAWRRRGATRAMAPALGTALASALALWGIHVSPAIALGRIDDALSLRSQWSDAAWARAQDHLGLRALREHRPQDAIRALEAAVSVAPNPRYLFELGLAQRDAGNQVLARKAFERAVARNRAFPDAWMGIGIAAYDEGDYRRALACLDSALKYAPGRHDIEFMRGSALDALHRESR